MKLSDSEIADLQEVVASRNWDTLQKIVNDRQASILNQVMNTEAVTHDELIKKELLFARYRELHEFFVDVGKRFKPTRK